MSCDAETEEYLLEKWELITNATEVPKSIQEKWWLFLKTNYSGSNRKYHTFFHLKRMFNDMELVIDEIHNKDAVYYAVFFHDVINNVSSHNNEEESYKCFAKFVVEGGQKVRDLGPFVRRLIMASKDSRTEPQTEMKILGKDDVNYFLDLDISILGSSPDDYKKYADQIREEYDYLQKPKYNNLRVKVLQQFLKIPNIYLTQIMQEKFEKQARINIQDEIDSIQNEGKD